MQTMVVERRGPLVLEVDRIGTDGVYAYSWSVRARNGDVVLGTSGELYTRRRDAMRGARRLMNALSRFDLHVPATKRIKRHHERPCVPLDDWVESV